MISSGGSAAKLPMVAAMALSAILVVQGTKGYRVLAEKASAQEAVTESVQRWRQSYLALAEAVKRWGVLYAREDSVQDLVSLYGLVNVEKYGLQVDKDSLVLSNVDQESRSGMSIGLSRICLATGGAGEGAALEVRANTYQALFAGVKALAARRDIYISTISIKGAKALPTAYLGDFCVLMRKA